MVPETRPAVNLNNWKKREKRKHSWGSESESAYVCELWFICSVPIHQGVWTDRRIPHHRNCTPLSGKTVTPFHQHRPGWKFCRPINRPYEIIPNKGERVCACVWVGVLHWCRCRLYRCYLIGLFWEDKRQNDSNCIASKAKVCPSRANTFWHTLVRTCMKLGSVVTDILITIGVLQIAHACSVSFHTNCKFVFVFRTTIPTYMVNHICMYTLEKIWMKSLHVFPEVVSS